MKPYPGPPLIHRRKTPGIPIALGVADIYSLNDHRCARPTAAKVCCWGNNFFGACGAGAALKGHGIGSAKEALGPVTVKLAGKAVDLAAEREHTCAALGDGSAWCWGENAEYQLGDGTDPDRPAPARVKEP